MKNIQKDRCYLAAGYILVKLRGVELRGVVSDASENVNSLGEGRTVPPYGIRQVQTVNVCDKRIRVSKRLKGYGVLQGC